MIKERMNFPKGIALMIIVGIVTYALLLYFNPTTTPESPKKRAIIVVTPIVEPQTKLYFSPSFIKLSSPQPQEIPVMITTGQNTISQAQVEIQYDPKAITVTSVRSGSFFRNTLPLVNKNDIKRGRIEFAIGVPETQSAIQGTGPLLFMQLVPGPEASISGQTSLRFLPKSSARGREQTTSLLISSENLIVDPNISPPSP